MASHCAETPPFLWVLFQSRGGEDSGNFSGGKKSDDSWYFSHRVEIHKQERSNAVGVSVPAEEGYRHQKVSSFRRANHRRAVRPPLQCIIATSWATWSGSPEKASAVLRWIDWLILLFHTKLINQSINQPNKSDRELSRIAVDWLIDWVYSVYYLFRNTSALDLYMKKIDRCAVAGHRCVEACRDNQSSVAGFSCRRGHSGCAPCSFSEHCSNISIAFFVPAVHCQKLATRESACLNIANNQR